MSQVQKIDTPAKDSVEAHLRALGTRPCFFLANYGNAGDSLIAVATYQLFRRIGLKWNPLHPRRASRDLSDAVLIYGGGGGLTPQYEHGSHFLAEQAGQVKQLIVLPHTIVGQEALLKQFGGRATVFCREPRTLEHVQRTAPDCHALPADDLGLSLNVKDARRIPAVPLVFLAWLRQRLTRLGTPGLRSNRLRLRATLRRHLHLAENASQRLNCFREDLESPEGALPPDNVDISAVYGFHVAPEIAARMSVSAMLAHLDAYEEIHTNRLHVAIAGGLLGKRVYMSANNYFKNRAIYEYSLRERFPTIYWEETPFGEGA
ncbi:MAG: polysaccharide pyruvyl transferase family protein [Opitutales bacterium]